MKFLKSQVEAWVSER